MFSPCAKSAWLWVHARSVSGQPRTTCNQAHMHVHMANYRCILVPVSPGFTHARNATSVCSDSLACVAPCLHVVDSTTDCTQSRPPIGIGNTHSFWFLLRFLRKNRYAFHMQFKLFSSKRACEAGERRHSMRAGAEVQMDAYPIDSMSGVSIVQT
jgi:hypothetical protein